ncbi:NAD(P)/FAD-dependent oxidoreductase [Dyella sp. LX-66]|uniref:NAD(P)/FAD-dependent oxidoreductase n=1 Tax=unclassified Dyella TaxID=2634549 RepID=UPI001BE02D9A|nr:MULTISPECIES: NAD(P)/FAD-dependent oxidoreductase [unclassified Dyella]MBT2118064.1 NAD(P)/FAD-dependent oxidoreductase [Dyella sp. LX-1]MBT2140971.1 NAD(P)/FAD-dependent oxidoreductase [Dyella sp. LX-66]
MSFDVIVVGGSFAGLAAALQLARARRKVLVVDAGMPRNRFAAHSHGFLGHDGKAPAQILSESIDQLLRYPTMSFRQGMAATAAREGDGFRVTLDDGATVDAERLILALGVRDELPALPGLAERWGQTVVHCPYCHGYELEGPLGVLATHPSSAHQALLVPDWGPTTLFTQGMLTLDEAELAQLANRGVRIEPQPVVELLGEAPRLDGVRLADERIVPMHGLFVAPRTRVASPLAEQLGCEFDSGPLGSVIRVDGMQQTTVPGVFAAGDAATLFTNATRAASAGVMAGVAAHRSLFMGVAA